MSSPGPKILKLGWCRGMPGGFACDSDTFQVGFHAEHLFLESMGEIASQFEDTRAIT